MGGQDKSNAEIGMEFLEKIGEILDMVDGYRAQCKERGYSETAAEQMAVQLHDFLLSSVSKQMMGK